ncbi:unnamed protein product [marine sediment metagenome]|uniref:Uncharacterized protein n=1 Tax=marine sediment metagenome TaxID=412755 RepID=X1A2S1_9ZZZZ
MTKELELVKKVLGFLASIERDNAGYSWQTGPQISENLSILPVDVADAVEIAHSRGWVKWMRVVNTAPYVFGQIMITPEGRLWLDKTYFS